MNDGLLITLSNSLSRVSPFTSELDE